MQQPLFRTRRLLVFAYGILSLLLFPAYAVSEPQDGQPALQAQQEQTPDPAIQQALASSARETPLAVGRQLPVPPPEVQPLPVDDDVPLSMQWLPDEQGTLTLHDILTPENQKAFAPYMEESLPRKTGAFWLRLPLTGPFPAEPVLDLNTRIADQLPDIPQVWLAQSDGTGAPLRSTSNGLYPLPSSVSEGSAIYLRVNGLPAPGFEPSLISKASIGLADEMGEAILLAVLAVTLFICLLRGLTERREWRMWAALYIGAIWVQSFWGLPGTSAGVVSRWDLPGLLAPGVALLILPHVGRHIMQTRDHAHILDLLYILLGLAGMTLAAVPLIPDYAWTLRYLPFWPLFTLLLLPVCLVACLRRLPGAKRFFLICLLPPLGILAPISLSIPENTWLTTGVITLLPAIGLTLSALFSALFRSPKPLPVPNRKKGNRRTEEKTRANTAALSLDAPLSMGDEGMPELILRSPDEPAPARPAVLEPALPVNEALRHEAGSRPILPGALRTTLTSGQVEGLLRAPLDALLREISALDQMYLSPEARVRLEALSRAGKTLTGLIGNMSRTAVQPEKAQDPQLTETFDLNQLLLEVHNAVEEQAEAKNLGLTWFTAPHLPRYYDGQRVQLAEVLEMLTESAVLATERGMVQIRAQRVPESTDPGHLLFTVSDTGAGTPPFSRSSLAFVRAWELAAAGGNSVSLTCKPEGTTVSFSMHLTVRSAEVPLVKPETPDRALLAKLPASSLRILVASGVPANRQLLAYYLDELPHEILEARNPEEAQQIYCNAPGALIIFDDDMPEESIAKAVAAIRIFEGEHNFPLASILALVSNDAQAIRLRRAGCTHTLMKPVVRKELRHLTLRLAPVPRKKDAGLIEDARLGETPAVPGTPETPVASRSGLPLSDAAPAQEKRPGLLARLFKRKKSSEKQPETVLELQPEAPAPEKGKLSSVGDPMPIPRAAALGETRPETPSAPAAAPSQEQPPKAPEREERRQPRRRQPAPAVRAAFPDDLPLPSGEWVGEPMPISSGTGTANAAGSNTLKREKTTFAAPPDSIEWVGDPMPVTRKTPVSRETETPLSLKPLDESARKQSAHSEAPIELVEWVGEPMPIPKKKDAPLTLTAPRTGLELVDTPLELHADAPSDQIITLTRQVEETKASPAHSADAAELPDLFGPVSESSSGNLRFMETIVELGDPVDAPDPEARMEVDADTATSGEENRPAPHPGQKGGKTDGDQEKQERNEQEATDELISDATADKTSVCGEESAPGDDSDATIQCLLRELGVALEQIVIGQKRNDAKEVRKAAARIAKLAETFDLRVLDDPARCIEMAAEGGDMEEIAQLIPDLTAAVARNRASFEETV